MDLISTNVGATQTNTYTFASNSPDPTLNHNLLLATPGFGSLPGGVSPDFEISTQFLFTGGGTLKLTDGFQTAFNTAYGPLPSDGATSLNGPTLNEAVNSPTNYDGQSGSVPEPAGCMALGLLALLGLRRRQQRFEK